MKIRITHYDKDDRRDPLIRCTFFCERENGHIDLFGKAVFAKRCWITSWEIILDININDIEEITDLAKTMPFKQAIQRTNGIHIEEYHGCKVEKVADDFDWRNWVVWHCPLEWKAKRR
jgi:hypothetical protein